MLEAIVGVFAWAVANVAYYTFKRRGRRGFRRFVAFWMGTPTTWATFFLVREGRPEPILESDEGLDELLREIRADRRQRLGGGLGGS